MHLALVSVNKCGCEPTSLLYLASYINSKTKDRADIIDSNWTADPVRTILQQEYDTVGISAMTCDYEQATRLAIELKKKKPSILILIGGIHISCLPESTRSCFDIAVIGEGETYFSSESLNLEDYPALDRNLLNVHYWDKKFMPGLMRYDRSSILMGSRGCPYHCIFCASPVFWKGYRSFSIPWIIRELQDMFERGIRHVVIFDDIFTCQQKRLEDFAVLKERAGLKKMTLSVNSRSSLITKETCELLRASNVQSVMFGWESGNQRVLNILKGQAVKLEDNYQSIKLCKKYKLLAMGGVVFDNPTETWKEKLDSIKFIWFAWWNGAAAVTPFKLHPLPGTKIWKQYEEKGIVSSNMNFNLLDFEPGQGLQWWIKVLIWFPLFMMKIRKCLWLFK